MNGKNITQSQYAEIMQAIHHLMQMREEDMTQDQLDTLVRLAKVAEEYELVCYPTFGKNNILADKVEMVKRKIKGEF
jgi:hypothetical protein